MTKIDPVGMKTALAAADHTYEHTAGDEAFDAAVKAGVIAYVEATGLEADLAHWQANHAEMVQRNAVLRERSDLPADRLPSIARYEARIAKLEAALREIADEPEIHTKLNEVRLCCKFQHIAITALPQEPS